MSAKTASLFWFCWNNIWLNDTSTALLFCLQGSISEGFKLILLQQKKKKGRKEEREEEKKGAKEGGREGGSKTDSVK